MAWLNKFSYNWNLIYFPVYIHISILINKYKIRLYVKNAYNLRAKVCLGRPKNFFIQRILMNFDLSFYSYLKDPYNTTWYIIVEDKDVKILVWYFGKEIFGSSSKQSLSNLTYFDLIGHFFTLLRRLFWADERISCSYLIWAYKLGMDEKFDFKLWIWKSDV